MKLQNLTCYRNTAALGYSLWLASRYTVFNSTCVKSPFAFIYPKVLSINVVWSYFVCTMFLILCHIFSYLLPICRAQMFRCMFNQDYTSLQILPTFLSYLSYSSAMSATVESRCTPAVPNATGSILMYVPTSYISGTFVLQPPELHAFLTHWTMDVSLGTGV